MKVKKLEIDSLGYEENAIPNYGHVTVEVGGRLIRLKLDETQIARFVDVAEHTAREIIGELKAAA